MTTRINEPNPEKKGTESDYERGTLLEACMHSDYTIVTA